MGGGMPGRQLSIQINILVVLLHFCISIDLEYHVDEESSPQTFIGDVAADAMLGDSGSLTDRNLLTYNQLQQEWMESSQLFNVTQDGKLYTAHKIDAESLCKPRKQYNNEDDDDKYDDSKDDDDKNNDDEDDNDDDGDDDDLEPGPLVTVTLYTQTHRHTDTEKERNLGSPGSKPILETPSSSPPTADGTCSSAVPDSVCGVQRTAAAAVTTTAVASSSSNNL
uniref:Cadherin N-terminal domain-containing protein n=1 Tax=Octopus bimaculoides TaxID=37653 RepID=A0A0L8HGD9_OCTBM